jgi:hypothetical protein
MVKESPVTSRLPISKRLLLVVGKCSQCWQNPKVTGRIARKNPKKTFQHIRPGFSVAAFERLDGWRQEPAKPEVHGCFPVRKGSQRQAFGERPVKIVSRAEEMEVLGIGIEVKHRNSKLEGLLNRFFGSAGESGFGEPIHSQEQVGLAK